MTSDANREFMALMAVRQHHSRPHTPTDQAWIDTLFRDVKGEWPHLERIDDPQLLETELDRVRHEDNHVRLHHGIGYVTPLDDEHHGCGEHIRRQRIDEVQRRKERCTGVLLEPGARIELATS